MLKVIASALTITVLFNLLTFNSQLGIGFSVFAGLLNLGVLILRDKNAKNLFLSFFLGGASAIFALLVSFRSSGVIQLIDLAGWFVFLLLNLYFSKSKIRFDYSHLNLLSAPFKTGLNFIEGVVKTFIPQTWADFSTQKHITSALLRGVFIGIPIIAVLFIILSKADPIFENLTLSYLNDVWLRIIFSLVVFISVLAVAVMKIFETESEFEEKQVSEGKEYELLVILGGLAILFGGFIFIQFKYLFSSVGERQLLDLGVKSLTYSEYVRKGFFELLLASVISSAVVLYALQYIHKLKSKGKFLVQVFTSIVTLEVGLLLYSAAQRVFLYQAEHGLTRARVFGMFFLVWLAILLVILLVKIVKDLSNKSYLSLNIISTLLILILVNFINVDELIATKYKPSVNDEIDYYYLSYLSPEAHLSWLPATKLAEEVLMSLSQKSDLSSEDYRILYWNLRAMEQINAHITYLSDKYGPRNKATERHNNLRKTMDKEYEKQVYGNSDLPEEVNIARKWQSGNFGEYLASEYIEENSDQFSKLSAIIEGLKGIQSKIPQQVIQSTVLDRSINPPLSN